MLDNEKNSSTHNLTETFKIKDLKENLLKVFCYLKKCLNLPSFFPSRKTVKTNCLIGDCTYFICRSKFKPIVVELNYFVVCWVDLLSWARSPCFAVGSAVEGCQFFWPNQKLYAGYQRTVNGEVSVRAVTPNDGENIIWWRPNSLSFWVKSCVFICCQGPCNIKPQNPIH